MNKLKRNKYSRLTALVLFIAVISTGFSQTTKDFETWSSIGIAYKLTEKWDFGLEEQLRLKNNSSEVDQFFTHLNINYEAFDNFELGGGLRYIKVNDNKGNIQGYEDHFRFHLDVSYKHKINNFSLKYRLRYQNKNELGVSASNGDYANQHIRFKTSIGYDIKKWKLDPTFSVELFNHFEEGKKNDFDKYRLTLKTAYKIKKIGKLDLFYRMEKELNVLQPKTIDIIGCTFTYSLKNN